MWMEKVKPGWQIKLASDWKANEVRQELVSILILIQFQSAPIEGLITAWVYFPAFTFIQAKAS